MTPCGPWQLPQFSLPATECATIGVFTVEGSWHATQVPSPRLLWLAGSAPIFPGAWQLEQAARTPPVECATAGIATLDGL